MDRAQPAVPEDLACLLELHHAALLRAHLHNPAVFILRPDDGLPLAEIMREWLLHVYVLAAVAGIDCHRNVPVVGRSDENGVDVAPSEQFAVVLRHERIRAGNLSCAAQGVIPDVAHRGDPRSWHVGQVAHQSAAASARTDAANIDRVVRRVGERTRQARGGRPCEKIPPAR